MQGGGAPLIHISPEAAQQAGVKLLKRLKGVRMAGRSRRTMNRSRQRPSSGVPDFGPITPGWICPLRSPRMDIPRRTAEFHPYTLAFILWAHSSSIRSRPPGSEALAGMLPTSYIISGPFGNQIIRTKKNHWYETPDDCSR